MNSEKTSLFERFNAWIRQSVSLRLFTIFILILFLLIPVSMIESLINEREHRKTLAIEEVSSIWGNDQTIRGLVLTVPFKTYSKVFEDNGKKFRLVETVSYAHFLPERLDIKGVVQPEKRFRGIYEVIVYNARMNLSGVFQRPDFSEWKLDSSSIMWDAAFVSLGLSDLRSIQEDISVKWNNREYYFNPGIETKDVVQNGISAKINMNTNGDAPTINFALDLNFNGSSSLRFVPLGKTTNVNISSGWPDPSFSGAFLPDKREVRADGFTASWKVLHLNRPYPQKFWGPTTGIEESAFGVDLFIPVDQYQKSTRSAKYAVMFITLTFLIFFFVQVLNGVRIHPIQYIIVGLALCMFYTLLIALSEHISFTISYIIASVSIIVMVTVYANGIFKRKDLTRLMALILTALYVFIYSIIQMEDYALLMGSIGLFLVLATIMYLSRKINWYEIRTSGDQVSPDESV